MNEPAVFHYGAARARLARLNKLFFTGVVRALLVAVAILLAIGGVALLALHTPFGWLVFGFAAIPLLLLLWWKGAVKNPALGFGNTIDDRLSGELLTLLEAKATPKSVASHVMECGGGQFFAVRFGISPNFLQSLTSDNAEDMAAVWTYATEFADALGKREITAAMVLGAIIKAEPALHQLLPHLQLDVVDIEAGVRWHSRINDLVKAQKQPKRTGGIARDWSFGYVPLLQRFGQNVSERISSGGLLSVDIAAHRDALAQLKHLFESGGRQNVALVGAPGSGKSTIVQAFARDLLSANGDVSRGLKFRQVYMLDPSSLLAAAPGRGELEGLVTRLLNEAYRAKNIVLWFDNAENFFQEGVGSVDLSNLLLPALEAGGLRMIMTMDEQRWLQIASRNPNLAQLLNRINVSPASRDETMLVLQDQLILTEYRQKVTYMYQALKEAYRLSERYVYELAQPGKALKLLVTSAQAADQGFVTLQSVQKAIEGATGVKVAAPSDGDEREKLLNLEELIHKRMINQTHAVKVVSDALRRARAGVRNQNRPVGTFLFLGPTGVGKTELAKALADVYFGGEQNLIRLDLNEFSQSSDVGRLIADGSQVPNSLTAQVMKQPFAVVLLDEIEKAHPSVLATLLQLLDEGILRDSANREVNFRDAIIIATSNAGSDDIRAHIERGESLESFEPAFIDGLISSNQFRPEFLNRFDEIVTFRPLNMAELMRVVDLILSGVNKNLALQKISVEVDQAGKELLVEKGYDPRLGARPMRRMVQRTVENMVARQMLAGNTLPGQTIHVSVDDIRSILAQQ